MPVSCLFVWAITETPFLVDWTLLLRIYFIQMSSFHRVVWGYTQCADGQCCVCYRMQSQTSQTTFAESRYRDIMPAEGWDDKVMLPQSLIVGTDDILYLLESSHPVHWCTLLCSVISAALFCILLYYVFLCWTLLLYSAVICCTLLYYAALYCTMLYSAALLFTLLHFAILCCTCCILLNFDILCSTLLQYSLLCCFLLHFAPPVHFCALHLPLVGT